MCLHACTQTQTHTGETGNRGHHCAPDSQMKSISVCRFPLLYHVSILSSSALRFSCVYLTRHSAAPAIVFEQRQRLWRSYRAGCHRRQLSLAKGRLISSVSSSLQVIYYSRLHLVSGQQVDSRPQGSSILTSADTSAITVMITCAEGHILQQ